MNKHFVMQYEFRASGEKRGELRINSVITSVDWGDEKNPDVTSTNVGKQLRDLGEIDALDIHINSPGGSVTEAVAIRTLLMQHPAKKTVWIDSLCASAATIICCMPGAEVKAAKGSMLMIHNPSTIAFGDRRDMESALQGLKVCEDSMVSMYAQRTGKDEKTLRDWMDAETWMTAEQMVENGFADEVIQEDAHQMDIAASMSPDGIQLMQATFQHVPEAFAALAETAGPEAGTDREPSAAAEGSSCIADARDTENSVSHGSAVAAASPAENNPEGVEHMDIRTATADDIRQENPEAFAAITAQAVQAERERLSEIDALTPLGDGYADMAEQAKADGTSAADFLKAVVKRQKEGAKAYLAARAQETAPAAAVAAGDTSDVDGRTDEDEDKVAKELAQMSAGAASAADMF